jgi:6-phosphofructo-2-kinase/fructose-2,6-biphosphatase 2
MDPEVATQDFKERMRHYEKAYETIAEDHLSFVKLINVGSLVIIHLIKGWLQSRIVYFLMNLHTQPRRILISRVCFGLTFNVPLPARSKPYELDDI